MSQLIKRFIKYIEKHSIQTGLFILHTAVFVWFLKLSYYVVDSIKPMPTSDFIYYWNLAGDLSIYHKGGIIGFIYAPFKMMGIEPYWSALIVNSIFYAFVYMGSWLTFKKFASKWCILGQLLMTFGLAIFGLWNAGYAGMVNADFPNVALLIISAKMLSNYMVRKNKGNLILFGIFLFLAVALRVKTGLALGIILTLLVLFRFKSFTRDKWVRWIAIVICLSVGFAAITEIGLRMQSDRQIDVQRQGRLQLYTGLLYTSTGNMCGRWTREAYDKTLEELDDSLITVVQRHLGVKSKRYIAEIILCKWDHVLRYDEFSFRELLAFGVTHRSYTELDLEIVRHYEKVEEQWMSIFKYLVYLMTVIATVIGFKRKTPIAIMPIAILSAFMLLHSVFEIQARYMVEPLMWSYFTSLFILFEISSLRNVTNHEKI